MQHLVVEQILDRIAWARWPVKDFADDNGVVRGIVMTQQSLRVMLAPSQLRPPQKSVEEALIQRIEDLFQVVVPAFRSAIALGAACTANLLRLPGNGFTVLKAFVAIIVLAIDRLFIDFGDENMRYGAQHTLRRAFQQIRKAYMQLTFAQPDRRIERDESPEADMKRRHRRARAQRAILLFKN